MIPDQTVQEIQQRLDIIEVIGGYVLIKKAGRNFKGLCPFHPEKTPSFMVYPEKQFFICYGCGVGGDLIAFVMRHEHLEFVEAVQLLAQKAGVEVRNMVGGGASTSDNSELYRAQEVAARFYHDLLVKSPEAEESRVYLKKRGLEPATWEIFSLGYAPNRWDRLLDQAQREKLTPEILEKGGLVIRREGNDGCYDRFRNRVMFPISDSRGRVIAFGGRVFGDESGPKYMNSPETELYVKGRVLYGLHIAAQYIREKDFCIVVEGYMDLVSPYQYGVRNVVASMGTSLTPEQVKLIRRYTRHVVILYDGDYAGEMATLRGLDLFLEAEMRIKIAVLPNGLDPDSVIKTYGIKTLIEAIQKSQDLFDYKLGLLRRKFDPKELEGRVSICQEMLPTIKRVPNPIKKGEYIKRLGELLGIAEELLWMELKRVKLDASWQPSGFGESPIKAGMTAEDLLAGLLLERPTRVTYLEGRLSVEDIKDPAVQRLVTWLVEQSQQGSVPEDYRTLAGRLPRGSGEWESRLAKWLSWSETVEEKDRALEEVILRIRKDKHRAFQDSLQASIRQAEEAGDKATTEQLLFEFNRLVKTQAVR